MGIQPIDLQNMYSQISNVARNVGGQQQAAQVAESVQQQNQLQKNIEMSQKVHETNNDKANTNNVNPDGHMGGGGSGTYKKPKKKGDKNENNSQSFGSFSNSNPAYVGTIVDITR